jgi:hypothetical protein
MTKQFKAMKALALIAAIGCGEVFALGTPAGPAAPPAAPAGVPAPKSGGTGSNALPSVATTSSSTVVEASLMAIKKDKIMGLVGAVTAEAAAVMASGGGSKDASMTTTSSDGKMNVAGSTGSGNRSSAWVRASYGAIDNAAKGQKWNGASYLTMVGADYKFNNMFCAGLGLSYSNLNGRTEFNNGTTKQDTMGVNPYFIIVPHKNFNIEFVGGWSTTKAKDERTWESHIAAGTDASIRNAQTAAANPGAGNTIGDNAAAYYGAGARGAISNNVAYGLVGGGQASLAFAGADGTAISNKYKSSPKSQAMFGGVFANFVNTVGKSSFSAQVGYLMVQSKMKKFTESSASGLQFYKDRAAVQAANTYKAGTVTGKILGLYQMTPSVAPFVQVHGQYDVKENKGVTYTNGSAKYTVGRSAFGGGFGFHVRNDDALSGSLQFDYTKRGQLTTSVTGLRLHYGF